MQKQTDFASWLTNQLQRKNWKPSDLAKAAGVAKSTVTSWLKGDRWPFPENCHRIASALGFEPATVLEKAGRIHCHQALNDGESLVLGIYRKLSSDRKQAMLEMAEGLHSFEIGEEGVSKVLRNEKGGILIWVLVFWAIGWLLIPLLLVRVATSLSACRVTEQGMRAFYAADAGVEYAIWRIMDGTCPDIAFNTPNLVNALPVTITANLVGGPNVHLGASQAIVSGDDLVVGPIGGRRGFVYVMDAITGTIAITWTPADNGCPSSHDDPGWILALYADALIRPTSGITPTVDCFANRLNPVEDWVSVPITSALSSDCPFTLTISAPNVAGIYSLLFYNGIDSCSDERGNSLITGDNSSTTYVTTGVVTSSIHVISSTAASTVIVSHIELFTASENDVEVTIRGITRTFSITPTVNVLTWQVD